LCSMSHKYAGDIPSSLETSLKLNPHSILNALICSPSTYRTAVLHDEQILIVVLSFLFFIVPILPRNREVRFPTTRNLINLHHLPCFFGTSITHDRFHRFSTKNNILPYDPFTSQTKSFTEFLFFVFHLSPFPLLSC